jgi:multimeric flavodoxin WrbA
MSKLVVINGSYHRNGLTAKCLREVVGNICRKHDVAEVVYFFIEDEIKSCVGCEKGCVIGCRFSDQFQSIAKEVETAERVLIGSPVYLDMPTAKLVALLTRFNCYAEPTKREFFRGKCVHIHANGYCSGTKAVIRTLMGACEMLGFTIEGRSTTEYVILWKDKKVRGGMNPEEGCWIK